MIGSGRSLRGNRVNNNSRSRILISHEYCPFPIGLSPLLICFFVIKDATSELVKDATKAIPLVPGIPIKGLSRGVKTFVFASMAPISSQTCTNPTETQVVGISVNANMNPSLAPTPPCPSKFRPSAMIPKLPIRLLKSKAFKSSRN